MNKLHGGGEGDLAADAILQGGDLKGKGVDDYAKLAPRGLGTAGGEAMSRM